MTKFKVGDRIRPKVQIKLGVIFEPSETYLVIGEYADGRATVEHPDGWSTDSPHVSKAPLPNGRFAYNIDEGYEINFEVVVPEQKTDRFDTIFSEI